MTQLPVQLVLDVESLEGATIYVVEYQVSEAMQHLTRIDVVAVTDHAIDANALLGKKLTLRVTRADRDVERCFHGIVFSARHSSPREGHSVIELTALPRLARLEPGRDSRIFQEKSVPDVLHDVF